MSEHREALNALKTIANYCHGRDCETECIFFNRKDRGSVCRLVRYKFSPAGFLLDPYEIKPIEKCVEELERQEKP